MMSNYIDATPMFQHKFRTQNITDNLTFFNERVQRNQELDGTCPLCKTSIDEKYHIWTCKNSINLLPEIIRSFIDHFHEATADSKEYRPIADIRKNIPAHLASKFALNSPDSFKTPWMQGFVTDVDRNTLMNEYQAITLAQANKLQFDLMDAWQKSIYKHLWTPRVEIISNRIKAKKLETLNRQRTANRLSRGRGRSRNNFYIEEEPNGNSVSTICSPAPGW